MKVLVDAPAVAALREVGRRENRKRWYYASEKWPALLLVADGAPLDRLVGRMRVALFNFDTVDSNIVLDQFPAAPARWREMQIAQVTVRDVRVFPPGTAVPLSEALARRLGA